MLHNPNPLQIQLLVAVVCLLSSTALGHPLQQSHKVTIVKYLRSSHAAYNCMSRIIHTYVHVHVG